MTQDRTSTQSLCQTPEQAERVLSASELPTTQPLAFISRNRAQHRRLWSKVYTAVGPPRCTQSDSRARGGLEQFDWIPVWIEQLNLFAARAHDYIAPKLQAPILHVCDDGRKLIHG
jgi:hypothetical protein